MNSRPHLGTAYEKVCADVIARYKRLCGFETRFLMGNDEHSQNVFKKAVEEAGLDPLAYCDQMEEEFRKAWAHLDVSFDDFIRTTEPRHRTASPNSRSGSTKPATSTKASTRAGTASAARSSSRRRISSTATARCTRR